MAELEEEFLHSCDPVGGVAYDSGVTCRQHCRGCLLSVGHSIPLMENLESTSGLERSLICDGSAGVAAGRSERSWTTCEGVHEGEEEEQEQEQETANTTSIRLERNDTKVKTKNVCKILLT